MPEGWPYVSPWLLFAAAYAFTLLGVYVNNRREFKRCPEKGERYEALPLGYKLGCFLVVAPLFAGTLINPALIVGAGIAMLLLEAACVRWYRKMGLLP